MRKSTKKAIVLAYVVFLVLFIAMWARAASLQVSWNANTETDLAGYNVYWKAKTATAWTKVDAGNVTTLTIPNVAENTEYCTEVTAYDTSGNESGRSSQVCASLDTMPPAAPTGVKAIIQKIIAWLRGFFS